jgi:predicted transglutaminase-like cysteine proteinase
MIIKAKNEKTIMKLKLVNDFFNNVKYMIDIEHWKVIDYWATPIEFLGTRNGDCEDYAIAKYFALIQVGIPKEKLRISYVKLLNKRTQYEEAHMVLAYFNQPNSIPIILDNINQQLELASKRDDLKLIYSFNADGLWDAKNIGKEEKKENENNLYQWKTMMSKF